MFSAWQLAALYFFVTLAAVLTGHGRDICPACQYLAGHLAGSVAKVIVVDAQGGNAAAATDALFPGNDGTPAGSTTFAMASVLEAAVLSVGM